MSTVHIKLQSILFPSSSFSFKKRSAQSPLAFLDVHFLKNKVHIAAVIMNSGRMSIDGNSGTSGEGVGVW